MLGRKVGWVIVYKLILLVLVDVINGIISNTSAKTDYGVIIIKEDNKYIIKKQDTIKLRRKLKKSRNTLIKK